MTDQPLFYATLPYGPTMNTYWRTWVRKGSTHAMTYVSDKGKEYQARIKTIVKEKHKGAPLMGRLAINILASPPDKRSRDMDNLLKPLLDSLMYAELIVDDSQFDAIFIRRGPVIKGGSMLVQIIQDEPFKPTTELF